MPQPATSRDGTEGSWQSGCGTPASYQSPACTRGPQLPPGAGRERARKGGSSLSADLKTLRSHPRAFGLSRRDAGLPRTRHSPHQPERGQGTRSNQSWPKELLLLDQDARMSRAQGVVWTRRSRLGTWWRAGLSLAAHRSGSRRWPVLGPGRPVNTRCKAVKWRRLLRRAPRLVQVPEGGGGGGVA